MTSVLDPALPETAPAVTFADLDLPAPLREAVLGLGFTTPTAIQAEAIPALLAGRDITGVAQTGTGKTAAFGLPLLAAVDPELREVQAIVLAPTRELAMQVAEALESFASKMPGLEVVPVYGGSPYLPQQRALRGGAQVVVGTPGRVIDHLDRGSLKLDAVRFLALDEADEMLRMGFVDDVDRIASATPASKQVALFSATMPPAIRRVAAQHLTDPVEITVARQSSTVSSVRQTYAVVPFRHKAGALARVLAVSDADAAIVFVRTRSAAEDVAVSLVERGVAAAYISGDVAQGDREKIVERVRSGAINVLVATDVAARGLDIDRIGLVVNFDVPGEPEAYVHRIGRTGRAGRTGEALTFVTPNENGKLRAIERTTRQQLEQIQIPSPADVSAHRVAALLARVPARRELGRLDLYRTAAAEFLAAHPDVDASDLVAVLAALAVGDEGPAPRPTEGDDLDDALSRAHLAPERGGPRRDGAEGGRPRSAARPSSGGPRYRLAVGSKDGVQPGGIVGALTNEGGLTGKDLGKIDIFSTFSLVEIPAGLSPEAFDRIGRARVAGRPLRIRVDEGPRAASRPDRGASRGPAHHGPRTGRDGAREGGYGTREGGYGSREGGRDFGGRDSRPRRSTTPR
ncbi:DEAD/DEAH box helicase [Cellulomonas sp. ACRRI]|uniref:DEAD/DEAH box helicase n=1 Tax=Cellulomonas sp. ACRRI TaxID=2918188 RepID=UPI001EF2CDB3|nr:DEAD/DEAH box helicase [Cellulomonas sp. ACRRI]MCG7285510.1 DEAD/DEAH box helicase [Cellulomonas sp. ACRRI]